MITDEEFKLAMSHFASGVTVITTRDAAGNPHGLTVSAFCSLSADPPLMLACIHRQTGSHYAFFERQAFVVNVLSDEQQQISLQFAEPAGDKFNGINIVETPSGLPMIDGCLATLECRIVNTYDEGDHTILVGSVEKTDVSDGKPLVYFQGDYRRIHD